MRRDRKGAGFHGWMSTASCTAAQLQSCTVGWLPLAAVEPYLCYECHMQHGCLWQERCVNLLQTALKLPLQSGKWHPHHKWSNGAASAYSACKATKQLGWRWWANPKRPRAEDAVAAAAAAKAVNCLLIVVVNLICKGCCSRAGSCQLRVCSSTHFKCTPAIRWICMQLCLSVCVCGRVSVYMYMYMCVMLKL